MFKVLLVVDERIIREGISSTVPWEENEFNLVGAASSGVEAFQWITDNPPDIVITDIKMPVMDGIELISRVKESKPEIEFIILSGYGEFELAKRAMKYGVKHYLLKPCNENQIIEALNEIKNELAKKHSILSVKGTVEINPITETNKYSKLVKTMLQHVAENLDKENLSLKWIAEEVMFVNLGHLSRLFNNEVGEKFPQYVTRLRMEKAKELIKIYGDDKIYEVAERIGLGNNPQYFSQLFKKHTGCTPKEYKKFVES